MPEVWTASILSGPVLLLTAHGAGGLAVWGLRRQPLYALSAGLCILLLIVLSLADYPGNFVQRWSDAWTLSPLGLEFSLGKDQVPQLIFLHCLVGATLLLALVQPRATLAWPGLLLLLAGASLFVMLEEGPLVKTFIYPLFLLPLTAWVPAAVTQEVPVLRVTALAPALAAPCFVLAHWFIFGRLSEDPQNEELANSASVLLTGGLWLLCLPFPLYLLWRNTSEREALLPNAAIQLTCQFLVLLALFAAVEAHPPLRTFEPLYIWLGWAALITVIWGGVAAMGTGVPDQIWFYASMLNWGMILLVFTSPLERSWETILTLFLLRCLCLLACLAGLSLLRVGQEMREGVWDSLGHARPWSMCLLLFGVLGLVGFPLTSSFGPFWVTWQFIATLDWQVAVILALGTAFTALGAIRVLRLLLRPGPTAVQLQETFQQKLPAAGLLFLLVYISFAPHTLQPFTQALLTQFQ